MTEDLDMERFPGLSEWALNAITGVVIKSTRELTHRKGERDVKTEAENGAVWPQAKEC